MFTLDNNIYTISDLKNFLAPDLPVIKKGGKNPKEYINVPCAFDIETTSTYLNGEKFAYMYIFMLGINGRTIIGRTWDEFMQIITALIDRYSINENRLLLIYVHNLAFEHAFIKKLFTWEKVFGIKERTPIYARTDNGIEFRCSYILTNASLNDWSKKILKYKCQKMVGDLNYNLVRHHKTDITPTELNYCIQDVNVVMCGIQEKIDDEGGKIYKIPLTATGYCRRYARSYCLPPGKLNKNKYYEYRRLMNVLQIGSLTEYNLLHDAFMGGFTHTCPRYSGQVVYNVDSIDFTSSYPYQLIARARYPMSRGIWVTPHNMTEFRNYLKNFCCVFEVEFNNIESIAEFDNYIPVAHCRNVENAVVNNGRVYSAKSLRTTITELDFEIIEMMYKWDTKNFKIGKMIIYKRGYLPTPLVKSILDLYEKKTKLKGNTNGDLFLESEYLRSKQLLNAVFGMMCTNVIRDSIVYDNYKGWTTQEKLMDMTPEELTTYYKEELDKYNNGYDRFLFFPWGVYCTALARRALFSGLWEFSNYNTKKPCDYIYSDTDSIKGTNLLSHMDYIDRYNKSCENKLKLAMSYHGLDFELCQPQDVHGVKHLIGVWDIETAKNNYTRFKAYGAKRYVYEQKGELHVTVSGLNKHVALPYLFKKYKTLDNIFSAFEDGLYIPPEGTGKLTHTYIDDVRGGYITDYQGHTEYIESLSGVHLEPQGYEMTIAPEYSKFLIELLKGTYMSNRAEKH